MFCPKCGRENPDAHKFCKNCGKELPDKARFDDAAATEVLVMPLPQNLAGQTLDGKYRLDAKIGAGGMGDVYQATRLLIGDTVAVKILHAHLAADAQAAARFRREAQTAIQLKHRNIVALYDVGISSVYRVPYILMELAEGLTLRQIIKQQRILPLEFVVTAAAQICSALEEAHRLGIVHRDIKPENIIARQVATGWQIKILDFGIAKLYNQTDIGLTQDGGAMGTPQYMSPEQCLGMPLDGRSDIYSVGIVLYEMLCGTVPFKSAAASAVAIHQAQTPPAPPRQINPQIAPAIENLLLKVLSKQREMRPQTAYALAQEMIQAATGVFKSGVHPNVVSNVPPVAAPDKIVESHTLSDEILIEREPKNLPATEVLNNFSATEVLENFSAVESEIAAPVIINQPKDPKTEAKTVAFAEEWGGISKNDAEVLPPPIDEKTEQLIPKEDLSLVFEDAELMLDKILPDEHKSAEKIIEPKADNFNDNESLPSPIKFDVKPPIPIPLDSMPLKLPIEKPDDSMPLKLPIGKPLDTLPEFEDDTLVEPRIEEPADAWQTNDNQSNVIENSPRDSADSAKVAAANVAVPAEKSGSRKILLVGAIVVFLMFFVGGLIGLGFWFVSQNQTTEVADTPSETNTATNTTIANSDNNLNADISDEKKVLDAVPPNMAYVAVGDFTMGTDDSLDSEKMDTPAHSATVKPFLIDLTEVTNEDYKKFVDAAKYKTPPNWKNGTFPKGRAKFPVTGVDWDDANAYAKWANKRLPTEEEWEFAARGTDKLVYPWGNTWQPENANADNQSKGMREVGAGGKSPFGLYDMCGNAWEWTGSDAKAYANGSEFDSQLVEPKIIRGGFYGSSKEKATTTVRRAYGARGEKSGYGNTGFRCARDVSTN